MTTGAHSTTQQQRVDSAARRVLLVEGPVVVNAFGGIVEDGVMPLHGRV